MANEADVAAAMETARAAQSQVTELVTQLNRMRAEGFNELTRQRAAHDAAMAQATQR